MNLKRFEANPLIYPELHASIGTNINDPLLIQVPDWLPNPFGHYYMYFRHQKGGFIRLAAADRLEMLYSVAGEAGNAVAEITE